MGELVDLLSRRFVIAQTLVWQYFVLVLVCLWKDIVTGNETILAVYGAAVGLVAGFYFVTHEPAVPIVLETVVKPDD